MTWQGSGESLEKRLETPRPHCQCPFLVGPRREGSCVLSHHQAGGGDRWGPAVRHRLCPCVSPLPPWPEHTTSASCLHCLRGSNTPPPPLCVCVCVRRHPNVVATKAVVLRSDDCRPFNTLAGLVTPVRPNTWKGDTCPTKTRTWSRSPFESTAALCGRLVRFVTRAGVIGSLCSEGTSKPPRWFIPHCTPPSLQKRERRWAERPLGHCLIGEFGTRVVCRTVESASSLSCRSRHQRDGQSLSCLYTPSL